MRYRWTGMCQLTHISGQKKKKRTIVAIQPMPVRFMLNSAWQLQSQSGQSQSKVSISIESPSLNRNQYGTCMGLDAKASMPHLDNIEAPEKRDEQEQPAVGHCHRHSGGK